jgi:hypothetical protein
MLDFVTDYRQYLTASSCKETADHSFCSWNPADLKAGVF